MPRVKSSAVVKEPPVNAGHARIMGSIPGSGTAGGGNGNPFQCSCLGKPMDRGDWWATVHGVTRSGTKLSMHAHTHTHTHLHKTLLKELRVRNHDKD